MKQMLFYVSQKAGALELIKTSLRFVRSAFSEESQVQDLRKPVCS